MICLVCNNLLTGICNIQLKMIKVYLIKVVVEKKSYLFQVFKNDTKYFCLEKLTLHIYIKFYLFYKIELTLAC